jgi:hypothetical protein
MYMKQRRFYKYSIWAFEKQKKKERKKERHGQVVNAEPIKN